MMPLESPDVSVEEQLFTATLGLREPWTVQSVNFQSDAGRINFHVGFARDSHFECLGCGAADQPVHDTRARQWRHLNFFQYQAFVNCEIPRTRCAACGKTLQSAAKAPARTRKSYPAALRDEALKLAELKGVSGAAGELEIDSALIYNWRRVYRVERSRSELERHQAAEIARFKRELAEREEELEILGKAQAYFARKLK